MRTSQLAIIAAMVIVLGAMAFVYLTDNREIKTDRMRNAPVVEDSRLMAEKIKLETQSINDQRRISELEKEVQQLKMELSSVKPGGDAENMPSFTAGGDAPDIVAQQAAQVEIERLKHQNRMAMIESGLIVEKDADNRASAFRFNQEIADARPVGKVAEINLDHNFVVIEPIGQPNFSTAEGAKEILYIRRDGDALVKLTVDSFDSETGAYVAFIDESAPKSVIDSIQKGDEVVLSPRQETEETIPEVPSLPEVHVEFDTGGGPSVPLEIVVPDLPEPI